MNRNVLFRFTLISLASLVGAAAGPSVFAATDENVPAIGAAPTPPMGPGPGVLSAVQPGSGVVVSSRFGEPHTPTGNSFYPGFDARSRQVFVPTVGGEAYILSARTLAPEGQFRVIHGARVAKVTPDGKMVLILSERRLAAYSTGPGHQRLFVRRVGGNAIALNPAGTEAFIGGNMQRSLAEVQLPSGRVEQRFEVGPAGDLVWAHGQVFAADMKTGVVSALNPAKGKIVFIHTPERDPNFSYHHIPQASAGLMQMAVSPDGDTVYAAGFSGHILKISARDDRYLGAIPVGSGEGGIAKLSGLAITDGGRDALVTVENRKDTLKVRLSDGQVLLQMPQVASNRWVNLTANS